MKNNTKISVKKLGSLEREINGQNAVTLQAAVNKATTRAKLYI